MLVKIRILTGPIQVYEVPENITPTLDEIRQRGKLLATKYSSGKWREPRSPAYSERPKFDRMPLFVPGYLDPHGTAAATPLCQACQLYGEHGRCTGQNTLGTAPCGCPCRTQEGFEKTDEARARIASIDTDGMREARRRCSMPGCTRPTLNDYNDMCGYPFDAAQAKGEAGFDPFAERKAGS